MQREVSPVLHWYELKPSGAHKVVVVPVAGERFPVISQAGTALLTTVLVPVLVHPFLVTAKVNTPAASTVMHREVAPLLHK
jgi:hypothetical protein